MTERRDVTIPMVIVMIIIALLAVLCASIVKGQDFNYRGKVCATAPAHKHDDIVTVTMYVSSWNGCALRGVIHGKKFGGKTYTLFGGFESSTKLSPKQRIRVTYDRSCGQVLMAVFPREPGIR